MARMRTATGLKVARYGSGRNRDLISNFTVNAVSPGNSKPRVLGTTKEAIPGPNLFFRSRQAEQD